MLPCFLKPGVAVANHAESGESFKSSIGGRRFGKIFGTLQSGDYLFMQFGHNDMKDRAPDALASYKSSLARFVDEARKCGATPILLTSMERKAGAERDTLGEYPATVRAVAKEREVALIDLHAMSKILYRALGDDLGKAFQNATHTTATAATNWRDASSKAFARISSASRNSLRRCRGVRSSEARAGRGIQCSAQPAKRCGEAGRHLNGLQPHCGHGEAGHVPARFFIGLISAAPTRDIGGRDCPQVRVVERAKGRSCAEAAWARSFASRAQGLQQVARPSSRRTSPNTLA